MEPPPGRAGIDGAGRTADADGTTGFMGGFGAPGLAPTGGGLGFTASGGGGLFANELDGLEFAGEGSAEGFFHGVVVPFDGPIPGNTDTGLAEASAVTAIADGFGTVAGVGRALGGGGGAGADIVGGTSSK